MPTTPPGRCHPSSRDSEPRLLLEAELSVTLPTRLLRVLCQKLHTLRVAWHSDGLAGVLAATRARTRHSIITRTGWTPPPFSPPPSPRQAFDLPLELGDGTPVQRLLRELAVRRTMSRIQSTDTRVAAALRELEAVAGRDERVTIPVGDGVVMRVAADDGLARWICSGEFERGERQFAADYLRRGDVFIDVGANTGLFALLAAQAVGPHGAVHALEPGSAAFDLLETSVRINGFGWVTCHKAGLSNTRERRDLLCAADLMGAYSSLGKPINAEVVSSENIELWTLDEFLGEQDLVGRVALIKIDVEGWEHRVLEGGRTALKRPDAPVLQVEFADSTAVNAGSSSADVYEALHDFGFTMFAIDEASGFLLRDPKRAEYTYLNLIAAKVPSPLPKAWAAGCSPAQLRSAVNAARRGALGESGDSSTGKLETR